MTFLTDLIAVVLVIWVVMGVVAFQLLTLRGMEKWNAAIVGITAWPILLKQEYEEMKKLSAKQ